MKTETQIKDMRAALLGWYDQQGRSLPWRIRPEDRESGIIADPYAVWLSEIMLQQTTVPHATPYWQKFLKAFPVVSDLANADRDQIMAMWAGLGYYARARNLYKCAQTVAYDYGGVFPKSEAELLKLPGIGPYTAAAIAAICYNEPTNVVDGNVERVISRIFQVQTALPKAKTEIKTLAGTIADPIRPGDYAQALMDLGATLCSPRDPNCETCIWSDYCSAYHAGEPMKYPKKVKKKKRPTRFGVAFVIETPSGVIMQKRPENALLGGMFEFPGNNWADEKIETPLDQPLSYAPIKADWQQMGHIQHVFTHFDVDVSVFKTRVSENPEVISNRWQFIPIENIPTMAIPTVIMKIWKSSQKNIPD